METDGNADENQKELPPPIFAQVKFGIIRSDTLIEEDEKQLRDLLEEHGGECVSPSLETEKLPLEELTHIISTTWDFEDYYAATDALIPVVKPAWVHTSIKREKAISPRQFSPDPKHIFSDMIVSCADLPSGDVDAIMGGVLALGGQFSKHITKQVTHIVALTEDSEKCKAILAKKLKCKIVLPHWFDDCLKLSKKINERPYQFPDPEIMRKGPEEPLPATDTTYLHGATSPRPFKPPTPDISPAPHRRDGVKLFSRKHVMISMDLGIGPHLRATIEDMIIQLGGTMTTSAYKTDILICHYREGQDYLIAAKDGKDVGNLSWLYHLLTYNKWTSPMRRLLHYPIARNGLPGFHGSRISLSNYSGEARNYLQNLIEAAGGECTKTMRQDNTHLITAHDYSEKCTAAKEWNIHMVNHLWLEESYSKWQIQSLSNQRYTTFPPRTNLGECVGQTQINRQAIEKYFINSAAPIPNLNDELKAMKDLPQRMPMAQRDNNEAQSPSVLKLKRDFTTASNISTTPKSNGNIFKTPTVSRFVSNQDETPVPSTGSSRKAKDVATAKLHELAPDIALFQQEMKRVGGVIHGGRPPKEDTGASKKRRSVGCEESTDQDERDSKKRKKSEKPIMRLLVSSYPKWVAQPKKEKEDMRHLRNLGILLTSDPTKCTHLAAPHIVRTPKFVCAISYSPIILSASYIDACVSTNSFLPPTDYLLSDPDMEKKLDFKLTEACERAKNNQHQLLKDFDIYIGENIHGGFETFKSIVMDNGGRAWLYKGRSAIVPHAAKSRKGKTSKKAKDNKSSKRHSDEKAKSASSSAESETESEGDPLLHSGSDDESNDDKPTYIYLLSGEKPSERSLWPKFKQMVQRNGYIPRIVKADWLLDMAMGQRVRPWDGRFAWEDGDVDMENS
ncbi:MAG: hypothetical protein M1834_001827 [Cirrosporium novae-zelandiae]|nr:MAG: hypothetical protein M1834_001827 [Cirrosporium novae-zelandiae]